MKTQTTRKSKFWQSAAVAAVVVTGSSFMAAQAAKNFVPRQFVAQMSQQAQKEWNLSNGQRVKIKAILQDAVPRGIAIHDDMSLGAKTKKARLQQLHNQTQAKVMKVLSPTQRQKAVRWRENVQTRALQVFVRVEDELNLSPSQREKIRPIVQDSFVRVKSLPGNMNLTVAQKFSRLGQIHKDTRVRVDKVLSPAQRKQLDQITAEMRTEARRQFISWRDKS